ncbi:MAG: hypothetical protein QME61_01125 [Patescibacteria group bacterium]|nr:hypothetical protein [Patescibacteria group bacterium]
MGNKVPKWMWEYREGLRNGTLTVEDILAAENAKRSKPIKLGSVKKVIQLFQKKQSEEKETKTKYEVCRSCRYYRNGICCTPKSVNLYPDLASWAKDREQGKCLLKESKW